MLDTFQWLLLHKCHFLFVSREKDVDNYQLSGVLAAMLGYAIVMLGYVNRCLSLTCLTTHSRREKCCDRPKQENELELIQNRCRIQCSFFFLPLFEVSTDADESFR